MLHIMRVSVCLLMVIGIIAEAYSDDVSQQSVATVNGKAISSEQLQLQFFLDQLPEDSSAETRQQLIEQLVNRELIRQFLASRKISADPAKLDHQVSVVEKLIATRNGQLDDVLGRLHLTPASLREVLALPLAWDAYVRSTVTDQQIRDEWKARRAQLDGTRVRASQIVRLVPPDGKEADWTAAQDLLKNLREQIVSGKISFADAARAESQSPSGKRGGELGEFEYRGRVDESISSVAFATPAGQVSEPFRTRFGVHLVETQEVIPGQLSLEDAREEILSELGKKLWDKQVAELRERAKIQLQPVGE
ncbi:foldase protein PrsA [Planctomicrobium sp. SH661]|uniref:foldase protein PrsA n=1 Tax=Planctomicrobium sp. SH661 TaxID=3448124 RepID=UPI003F5C09A2